MGIRVIIMKDDSVICTLSLSIGGFMTAVELDQNDVTVDVELILSVLFRNSSFSMLIIVILSSIIAPTDDLPVHDSTSAPSSVLHCLLTINNFWDAI